MTYLRALGSGERVFCLRPDTPTHAVSAIEVTGDASVEEWAAALQAMQRRHPLLSTSIQIGEHGTPAFHTSSAAIPLRLIPGPIPACWEREMESELANRFDVSHGPLIRAVLFHEPGRAILLLSIVHSVTDGISGTFLVRDLLTALSGGRLDPLPLLPSMETLLGRLPAGPTPPMRLPTPPPGRAPVLAPDGGRPHVARRSLDETLARALRDRARQEGASVHGALCAAAALARQSLSGEATPLILSYPIDIRTILGVGEDNLYLLSGGMMQFPPSPVPLSRDEIWALARSAREQVKAAVSPGSIKASVAWLEQQFDGTTDPLTLMSKFGAFFASDINLTNLGQLQLNTNYGRFKLEAGWGAVLARWRGSITVSAHTINERICLTLSSHESRPTLLNTVECILRDACAG